MSLRGTVISFSSCKPHNCVCKKKSLFPNNFRRLFQYNTHKPVKGDVRSKDLIKRATLDSVVFHLAVQTSVDRSIVESERACEVNANGTLSVLEAALENYVELVVYASGFGVCGSARCVPTDERHELNPALYAFTCVFAAAL